MKLVFWANHLTVPFTRAYLSHLSADIVLQSLLVVYDIHILPHKNTAVAVRMFLKLDAEAVALEISANSYLLKFPRSVITT